MTNTEKAASAARNVLTSAVTWITAASVALAQIAEQVTDLQGPVAEIVASVGAVLAIVRRVSPVAKEDRGLA